MLESIRMKLRWILSISLESIYLIVNYFHLGFIYSVVNHSLLDLRLKWQLLQLHSLFLEVFIERFSFFVFLLDQAILEAGAEATATKDGRSAHNDFKNVGIFLSYAHVPQNLFYFASDFNFFVVLNLF